MLGEIYLIRTKVTSENLYCAVLHIYYDYIYVCDQYISVSAIKRVIFMSSDATL